MKTSTQVRDMSQHGVSNGSQASQEASDIRTRMEMRCKLLKAEPEERASTKKTKGKGGPQQGKHGESKGKAGGKPGESKPKKGKAG